METPVTFVNRAGHRLFGMLYAPDGGAVRRVGVIISVNAIKYRLGTFRLHVLLARTLCDLGYTVFSFDPAGIGDSEGEFDYKLLSEHYYDIQTGKYNDDLSDAIDYFTSAGALEALVVLGLCGGAISVLMQASLDRRVSGMILLNIPVLVEDLQRRGQVDNAAKITSSSAATVLLKHKLQRIADAGFWNRLLRGKVDLAEEGRLVGRAVVVLTGKLGKKFRGLLTLGPRAAAPVAPVSSHRLFNMHFQRAFVAAMAARKQLLFVFAELDPWTWIFKSEFQDLALGAENVYEPHYALEMIPAANHIFSSADSQRRLERVVTAWLCRHYPLSSAANVSPALSPNNTIQELS